MSDNKELKTDKLTVQLEDNGDSAKISISGNIDEDFDYKFLLEKKFKDYVVDFEGLGLINSCGIREWITLLTELNDVNSITYINCPAIIVKQMNMVDGLLPKNAYVESFYGPYVCEECDEETNIILIPDKIKNSKAPEVKCSSCNEVMEFDTYEDQYFRFIGLQENLKAS